MNTPLDAALAAIPATMDPFERARLTAMVHTYAFLWDQTPAEVLAVEQDFLAPFIRPNGSEDPDWLLSGRIDLVLRLDSKLVIVDHKTSSEDVSPGSAFRERLALHRQPPHYFIGARSLGFEPDAFMFDVLGKLGIEPLAATPRADWHVVSGADGKKFAKDRGLIAKATDWSDLAQDAKLELLTERPDLFRLAANQRAADETVPEHFERAKAKIVEDPDRFFARIEVHRNAAEMERYQRTLYAESTLIDTVREYGLATGNEGACHAYNRACEYHGGCSGTASFDDPTLFVHRRAHEELDLAVPRGKRLLTVSRLQSFNACRKKHELRYEQEIAPIHRDGALAFGTATHAAAEAYWRARGGLPAQGATHAAA